MLTTITDHPWMRQLSDTDKSFAAFKIYLDLPPPRTYRKVAEELDFSIQHMRQWGTKHNWRERARLYDRYMQTMSDEDRIDIIAQFQEEIVENAAKDYRRAHDIWSNMMETIEGWIEEDNVASVKDINTLVSAVNRMVTIRKVLDDNARRTARLPNAYKSEAVKEIPIEGEFILSMDGPPVQLPEGDNETQIS